MKIRVFLKREGKSINVKMGRGNVSNLLGKLRINPEAVIITKGRDLITEVEKLSNGDSLKIIHIKVSE